jgi:integrase/recombinase XerD
MSLPLDHPHIKHWTIGSTMRYVRPSETFIEDAYRRAVSAAVASLQEDGEADGD